MWYTKANDLEVNKVKNKLKEKPKLKIGDIIKFHSWGVGGVLFGIIVEDAEEGIVIWRPKTTYSLKIGGIDNIITIKEKEDIKDYEFHDLLAEVIKPADKIGIHYNFNMEV